MSQSTRIPVALTIAGSDSGGGAGIQADLKTFAALGLHGTSVLTAVTAQSPKGVRDVQGCRPSLVREQLLAVFDAFPPAAVKTGMLYSTTIIETVADFCGGRRTFPLIVDPVMVATSGAALLKPSSLRQLKRRVLPIATLITPNLPEASLLLGSPLRSMEEVRTAARALYETFGCAALVKGGHLRGLRVAVDFFYDGSTELLLESPWISRAETHGTGCTLAAAIAGYQALGCELPYAVELAKTYIARALEQRVRAGKHAVLQHRWT